LSINEEAASAWDSYTFARLPRRCHPRLRSIAFYSERYRGIVVVLDRTAEPNSNLLKDLVDQGSSINDVTRKDLLVALPRRQEDWRPGVQEWVLDPHKVSEHGVNAPGLLLAGADDRAWESRLWELVSDEVERCDSYEDQKRIVQAVDQSASDVVDYLGLTEDDIPSLVIFSLDDRRLFVFRYGGDADDPPYQLFKNIATRRPRDGSRAGWLVQLLLWRVIWSSPRVKRQS
jgi:hypothetical protein